MSLTTRYLIFILGVFFLAVGIDLIVVAMLGATPISSVNYVLSLHLPVTFGTASFLFNLAVILAQFWLVRGRGTRTDYIEILLQIPFSALFGVFIDLNMMWIERFTPESYPVSLAVLAAGCVIQAVGIVLEVKPDVVIMSAEGFVKYYCRRYGRDFGRVKVAFDVTLVISAVVISLAFSGRVEGVREGTLIAALCTGPLVNLLSRHVITRKILRQAAQLAGRRQMK